MLLGHGGKNPNSSTRPDLTSRDSTVDRLSSMYLAGCGTFMHPTENSKSVFASSSNCQHVSRQTCRSLDSPPSPHRAAQGSHLSPHVVAICSDAIYLLSTPFDIRIAHMRLHRGMATSLPVRRTHLFEQPFLYTLVATVWKISQEA